MTSFVIVNPSKRTIETVQCKELREAQALAGLGEVDRGSLGRRVGYIVHDMGMFVPAHEQSYFGCAGRLIAGTAVFYGVDEMGETVDMLRSQLPDVTFFLGINDIENAIQSGLVKRPYMAINGDVFWTWPNPAPEDMVQ